MVSIEKNELITIWISIIAVFIANDVFDYFQVAKITNIWFKWLGMGLFSLGIIAILAVIAEKIFPD